jgi:hypothetical protein
MKNIPAVLFLAALVAMVFSPLSLEVSGSLLFGAGLLAILVGDYSREFRSLEPRAEILPFTPAPRQAESFARAA